MIANKAPVETKGSIVILPRQTLLDQLIAPITAFYAKGQLLVIFITVRPTSRIAKLSLL